MIFISDLAGRGKNVYDILWAYRFPNINIFYFEMSIESLNYG